MSSKSADQKALDTIVQIGMNSWTVHSPASRSIPSVAAVFPVQNPIVAGGVVVLVTLTVEDSDMANEQTMRQVTCMLHVPHQRGKV